MPIRFVLTYCALVQTTIISNIVRFFHGDPTENGPLLKGTMLKTIQDWVHQTSCWLTLTCAGIQLIDSTPEFDYSYYLGPNYRENYRSNITTSTILCNHFSWMDGIFMLSRYIFSPVMEAKNRTMAIIGVCCTMVDALFVNRS